MGASQSRDRPEEKPEDNLGGLVTLPILIAVVLGVVASIALPDAGDCSSDVGGNSTLASVATLVAAIAILTIAVRELVLMSREGGLDMRSRETLLLAGVLAAFAALGIVTGNLLSVWIVGDLVTVAAFISLFLTLFAKRPKRQAGPMLLIYLFGMGIFVCPTVTTVFAFGNSGIGC